MRKQTFGAPSKIKANHFYVYDLKVKKSLVKDVQKWPSLMPIKEKNYFKIIFFEKQSFSIFEGLHAEIHFRESRGSRTCL